MIAAGCIEYLGFEAVVRVAVENEGRAVSRCQSSSIAYVMVDYGEDMSLCVIVSGCPDEKTCGEQISNALSEAEGTCCINVAGGAVTNYEEYSLDTYYGFIVKKTFGCFRDSL